VQGDQRQWDQVDPRDFRHYTEQLTYNLEDIITVKGLASIHQRKSYKLILKFRLNGLPLVGSFDRAYFVEYGETAVRVSLKTGMAKPAVPAW
jgi:hypothetical protein